MIDNLPNGWRVEKLGNLVKRMHQGINTAADKVEFSNSGYPILQTKNISKGIIDFNDTKYMNNEYWEKYKEKYKPKINDILLANIGTIGKNVIVKEESDYLIHWNIFLIEPNQTLITTNYLKSFFDKLYNQNYYDLFLKGGTVKFISKSFLIDLQIPIPPLQQQEKIVKVLDLTSNLIKKQKELLEKYDLFLKSKFIEMFGEPVSNPKGWSLGKLKDLFLQVNYGTSSKANEENKGFPILRMNNITYSGHLNVSDLKHIELSEKDLKKFILEKGDILFNRTNSKELVGKTTVFNLDEQYSFAGYLVRAKVNDKADPYFISYFLNSDYGKAVLLNMAKNIVGMANINAQEMQSIDCYIPPIELQNQFASIVEKIETIKEKENQKLKQLEDLHNSMMQKAFKGEI
ncbi:restriction endonuclease subunit S [Arcobacter ellisii]|uniref:Restriction endonuclease n=1 Tax=Arcobacter ellisii TaxID=913109 RepID=A0A347U802_9BACT|nr:restriction endonuclease subunit S [Arcobacter ellisii]AXX94980.1 type I restriction/modification system, specificity subunit [Arcobacter ellisii]RXI30304.1 restriction endonuclease [Arcobacter ellisii]